MADSLFSCSRILSPVPDQLRTGTRTLQAKALLVVALAYGRGPDAQEADTTPAFPARIAPFARRNYYAEAVARLQGLARELRAKSGGRRSDYQILCNSPIPEKPLAEACGLGWCGRNSLIITRETGSLCILAAMTLPFDLEGDQALEGFPCEGCDACVRACPSRALDWNGAVRLERCIQWYASNDVPVPPEIAAVWGERLYGCTICQDACPRNTRRIEGAHCDRGALPAFFEARDIETATDAELRALFKGTALGLSWITPALLRRNARLARNWTEERQSLAVGGTQNT